MGNNTDLAAALGKLFQYLDRAAEDNIIQGTEAFINEHGIDLCAAGMVLDYV